MFELLSKMFPNALTNQFSSIKFHGVSNVKSSSVCCQVSLYQMLILQDQNQILRTKWDSYDLVLTIWVLLIRVVSEAAVVPVIWDTIIVIIRITGISFAILIVVGLVGIGDVRAVILVVLVAIFVYVLIIVTLVTNQIIICISLPKKRIVQSNFIIFTQYKSTAWYLTVQHFSWRASVVTNTTMTTVLKAQAYIQASMVTYSSISG